MAEENHIRVRFAPSPTGYLHIGGARTALYNWLYARKMGGVFVLRIEDTDAARSTEESYEAIIDAMEWLGLDWDEGPVKGGPCGPYVQSARQVLYHTDAKTLLDSGQAYRCFCTREDLEEMRSDAPDKHESSRYDRRCSHLPADEVESRVARDVPHVIRFRIPEGETKFGDVIRGLIEFNNADLDDFVIIKSDGKPTYNFAAVVDDARMEISHVIRGDDHLSNTPKQVLIYKALGYRLPKFAHLPMILGNDRTRLSKRHGAASVQEFRGRGYLSDSLVNYLALLGWAFDDKTEIFTRDDLVKKFSLKKVSKNPAAFDPAKLDHIDGEHFKRLDSMKRVAIIRDKLAEAGVLPADFKPAEWGDGEGQEVARLAFVLKEMGNRLKNVKDAPEKLAYFYKDDFPVDSDAVTRHLSGPENLGLLDSLAGKLEALDPFDRTTIEEATRGFAEEIGVKAGDLIHPCRAALTGQGVSPDIFSVIHLLGREKSVERLKTAGRLVDGGRSAPSGV